MLHDGASLSLHLRETVGFFADPLHAHSFARVAVAGLTAIDRSMLFFRDCALCQQRMLWIGRQTRKLNMQPNKNSGGGGLARSKTGVSNSETVVVVVAGSGADAAVCQCLQCGKYIHRDCLSFVHLARRCRSLESDLESCSSGEDEQQQLQSRSSSSSSSSLLLSYKLPSLFPVVKKPSANSNSALAAKSEKQPPRLFGNEHLPASFTLSTLIEELSRDPSAPPSSSSVNGLTNPNAKPKSASAKSAKIARRVAPFLAAGGVLGAIALGPIGGMLAGLNVLVASVGVEAIAAGVGLTAATAAAATVSHKQKLRNAKRKLEKLKSGEWAMEICWNCKKGYQGVPSDEAFRKDAEFSRRFQSPPEYRTREAEDEMVGGDDGDGDQDGKTERRPEGIPSADEVHAFLFGLFSSPSEFLSQVNVQLCAAFRERHNARSSKAAAPASAASAQKASMVMRDTLQDTKMYVAHIMGATMQSFPSLASTDQALSNCSQAIERIVYDDIYAIVFREFETAFADADVIFHENVDRIRREQRDRPVSLLYHRSSSSAGTGGAAKNEPPVLHEDLQIAEQKLVEMIHSTCSPLKKLELLCTAFRAICCFADQLHQTASNADILIPIVCSLLISSPRLSCDSSSSSSSRNENNSNSRLKRTFVSEIAFISFLTNGGGKGVEGYVLTTFQAVIQVIAAVDLSNGPAKELELFMDDEEDEQDTEDEEFFDAVSGN